MTPCQPFSSLFAAIRISTARQRCFGVDGGLANMVTFDGPSLIHVATLIGAARRQRAGPGAGPSSTCPYCAEGGFSEDDLWCHGEPKLFNPWCHGEPRLS